MEIQLHLRISFTGNTLLLVYFCLFICLVNVILVLVLHLILAVVEVELELIHQIRIILKKKDHLMKDQLKK